MSGNWAQHAFIHPSQPKNDYVQSLTCINTQYNDNAFNDGYHTSHHLNPIRHWRDHPGNLIENREKYLSQGTIVFMGLDYWAVWFYLMCRDYKSLARAYVCLGDQKSEEEIIDILKSRTRPFTRDAIKKIYGDDCVFPLFTEWFGL